MNIDDVIREREQTHGNYAEVAAFAQAMKRTMRVTRNWIHLPDTHAQSLEALCDKVARILCGDYSEPDHWRDLEGYAALVTRGLTQPPATMELEG